MKASNTILLHDITCESCRSAIIAIRRAQRAKRYINGKPQRMPQVTVTLVPDINVCDKFTGFHVSLVGEK